MDKVTLSPGVDSFLLLDLLRKAATHKGLELVELTGLGLGAPDQSEPIKVYHLDDQLLSVLAQHGISRQGRPDVGDRIFTLVDENPQKPEPGYLASNFWNFQPLAENGTKFDLQISLYVCIALDPARRGIVLFPRTGSTYTSAADPLPNIRMFKALVEHDPDAPLVTKELAAAGPNGLIVSWNELGLDGLRSMWSIFSEFAAGNVLRDQLAQDRRVFEPSPHLPLFIIGSTQPGLIQTWRAQLEEYCARLQAE